MLYLFYLFAVISVLSALMVVAARSPVNSVISLIVCFLSIAGHYILLNAQFLAAVHIIVYTGAIMVLFLFVIMLLNLNKITEPSKTLTTRIAAVTAGALFLFTLLGALRQGVQITAAKEFDGSTGLVKSVGQSLFSEFLLPFEMSSVLFLSAIIGAVMLGRKDRTPREDAPTHPAPVERRTKKIPA
ncbi:MAG: NADH-quinone oxidoreductase subunit J [Flavobacteriales bacterium]|nr:NADH-quinone oxidoreductase subunit J [Flavobacteriales bacterium]MBK6755038.1 NADH-quinone oxidoreductase subunit J [Flavobacteriales bacterium]MBK9539249.1 NADH-quinone oxidoreductase subunit J [Flavobacteriales bacterium]